MGWKCPSIDFVAKTKKTVLQFTSTTSPQSPGPVIDNVSVTPGDNMNVTSLSPDTFFPGTTDVVVQVYGADFTKKTVISFSDPNITVTHQSFITGSHLRLTVNVSGSDAGSDGDLIATLPGGKTDTCGKSVVVPSRS